MPQGKLRVFVGSARKLKDTDWFSKLGTPVHPFSLHIRRPWSRRIPRVFRRPVHAAYVDFRPTSLPVPGSRWLSAVPSSCQNGTASG
eukprot:tig00020816_g14092.t1